MCGGLGRGRDFISEKDYKTQRSKVIAIKWPQNCRFFTVFGHVVTLIFDLSTSIFQKWWTFFSTRFVGWKNLNLNSLAWSYGFKTAFSIIIGHIMTFESWIFGNVGHCPGRLVSIFDSQKLMCFAYWWTCWPKCLCLPIFGPTETLTFTLHMSKIESVHLHVIPLHPWKLVQTLC